jgi:PleD family two-component response regulator
MGEIEVDETKPKVLIIDDSDLTLAAATAALEREGFEVRTATTLGSFSGILNSWSPHVVLTDVDMPGLTGPELCTWIKSRIQTADVPILLYSGLPDDELASLAVEAGADGYVAKARGLRHMVKELRSFCDGVVW